MRTAALTLTLALGLSGQEVEIPPIKLLSPVKVDFAKRTLTWTVKEGRKENGDFKFDGKKVNYTLHFGNEPRMYRNGKEPLPYSSQEWFALQIASQQLAEYLFVSDAWYRIGGDQNVRELQDKAKSDNRADNRLYRFSLAALGAGAAADTASSWGKHELNPVLGAGEFGGRQLAVKAGMTSGIVGLQLYGCRLPKCRRVMTLVNFGIAGAYAGIAARNWRMR